MRPLDKTFVPLWVVMKALVNIISNPVNSTVPIAAEVFKKAGTYDPAKLFGVTTLDVVRARTFYAAKMNIPVKGDSSAKVFVRIKMSALSVFRNIKYQSRPDFVFMN